MKVVLDKDVRELLGVNPQFKEFLEALRLKKEEYKDQLVSCTADSLVGMQTKVRLLKDIIDITSGKK